jgi:HD-like signal output (HDOD) protein/two-component sensor histidine kinase
MSPPEQDIRNRLLVARLPSMPQTLLKLINLCQTDEAGMAELADLIASDVGLMSKVLSIANSAAYHRGGPKVGLMQALSTMGADMIKTLVISESVFQTFSAFPHSSGTDLRYFWQHALTTAVMTRALAKKMAYPFVEEAYLAGLLHDVGRLALLAAAPNEYSLNFRAKDDLVLCEVEQETLQISHTEAGAWLIERWNLGPVIADGVLYHHENSNRLESAHPLVRMVHLADWLANHDPTEALEADAGALCGVDLPFLATLVAEASGQVKKTAADLGLELPEQTLYDAPQAQRRVVSELDSASQQLAEQVRDMAITNAVGQSLANAHSDRHLMEMIRNNAHILLNLNDSLLFLTTESGQELLQVSPQQVKGSAHEMVIGLTSQTRFAQAIQSKTLLFFGPERRHLDPIEDGLLQALNAECLVCVPVSTATQSLGMIVGSIPPWRLSDLKKRERFLLSFGLQAALSIESAAKARTEMNRRIATVRQEHLEDSRRVAHEVNNPLTIIKNYLSVLDEKLTRQESVSEELSILKEEIDRVSNLVTEFAGGAPKAQGAVTEVSSVIRDLARLFTESKFLPASVSIDSVLPAGPTEVLGSADILKQILINILKNAIEAVSGGGHIEMINNGVVLVNGREYAEISVKDSGPGIPPEVQARLFSPVDSRKPGPHRGIGLSIVHRLVQKLNGEINCQSSSTGTVFTVHLPTPKAADR